MKKTLWMALAVCMLASVAFANGPVKVGEEMAYEVATAEFSNTTGERIVLWEQEITVEGATYIAPHFSRFVLPKGAELTISAPEGSPVERSWTYTGFGKSDRFMKEGFWGIHIPGDTAVLTLTSNASVPAAAVRLDKVAHGFADLEKVFDFSKSLRSIETKAICGQDDADWAQCHTGTTMYDKARAVARLLMNGSSACTGWLVGDEGHLMTNEHCIGSASTANNTDYEFMAEGSCSTNCASWLGCPGTVVATSATLVQLDAALDYALVKLPTNVSGTYGFLQMRTSGAVVDERIYIPQHAAAWGKRIAVTSGASQDQSGFCEVYSLNSTPCSGGPGDIGYYCDTQGGSSGSPVLGYGDHAVVSLHHCANCPNRGLDIVDVIADLGGNLPNNSTVGGDPPPPPTCDSAGTACTSGATCCSGSCKGKPGGKTCK